MASDEYLTFDSSDAWRAWLERHHALATEAWVILAKKGAVGPSIRYDEAVEEALCFGWIDGRARGVDAQHYVVRFSPRRRRSVWSESNKQRVERLIDQARMTPAGLAKVAEAKANGEWDAAAAREDVSSIPPDLRAGSQARRGRVGGVPVVAGLTQEAVPLLADECQEGGDPGETHQDDSRSDWLIALGIHLRRVHPHFVPVGRVDVDLHLAQGLDQLLQVP